MNNFFLKTYNLIASRKLLSLFLFLALFSALAYTALQLKFEEDITKLIPADEEGKELQKVLNTVNFTDKIIVNIRQSDNGSAEDLTNMASAFVDSISGLRPNYIKDVQGQIEDADVLHTLDFVYNNLPLFLDSTDYKLLAHKIKADSISATLASNYRTLISPSGIIAKETILKDPLGLSFIGLKKLETLGIGDQFKIKNGFLLSKDEQNVLLFLTPTYGTGKTDENAVFVETLNLIKDSLNTTFKNKASLEVYGGVLVAVANAKQIKLDVQYTVGIAMAILLLIFAFFYRKVQIPLVLFVPTLFGGLLSIASLFLIRTQISAISLGIGSVLLGVTLDYSLHILTHLRNNADVKALYKDVTKPILMSSLTTAMAFLCLIFIKSQALQDLGIFAAISVLGASVFALIFIPQVYRVNSKIQEKSNIIDSFSKFSFHRNKWVIGTLIVLFIVSAFTYQSVSFNNDISKLNYEPKSLIEAKQRLDRLTNFSAKSIYITGYSDTLQTALQQNDNIYKTLNALEENNTVLNFSNVGALVQSKALQQEKISAWNTFWDSTKTARLQQEMVTEGSKFGFKPTTFNTFYEALEKPFSPINVADYNSLASINLADYISTKNGFTTVTSLVKVKEAKVTEVKDAFKTLENTVVIDRQQINETLLGNLKTDFNKLIRYSLIVVVVLLLLFYKSITLTLITSIPILLSWLLTIGLMGLIGLEFNIFNIIISTFIFGLGVDYCIFMTNGLLKEYRFGTPTLYTHKTSITLSVITTILGIGVLIFAKHPALYSIALVCIIGIFSAMFCAFTIQPLLFRVLVGSKHQLPAKLRQLIHSGFSFLYYGLGGLLLSLLSVTVMKVLPIKKSSKMIVLHKTISGFMKSVLNTNPFVKKEVVNTTKETFDKPAILIANHTSFLDILAIGMMHPKLIFLVNDWVYNSPIFGKAVQLAGFYPVSGGIEKGVSHLKKKVDEGYSLMAFPEGTRSKTNYIRRFHKGAFYLAEELKLDIIPILIHGNSEVLPKGSFAIKDGKITVEVLKRIPYNSEAYGTSYKEKSKLISQYFKSEFNNLRNRIETETYFKDRILNEYKYKGHKLFENVKLDLEKNKTIYFHIINFLDKKETIAHLGNHKGQLDILMALHAPNRKIYSAIKNTEDLDRLNNSYTSHSDYKLNFYNRIEDVLSTPASVLILDNFSEDGLTINFSNYKSIIIINSNGILNRVGNTNAFKLITKEDNLSIFKKIED